MAQQVTFIQGEDVEFLVQLKNKKDGGALSLSGVDEITARFKNTDGSVLEVTKTAGQVIVTGETCGDIQIELTDAQTALLEATEEGNMEILVDVDGDVSIHQYEGVLKVLTQLLPPA
jgi:hypothetical protein